MSHFTAQRASADSKLIELYKMTGDRRSRKPSLSLELTDGQTVEELLAENGLEMVGRWINTETMGANARTFQSVNVFPIQ